MFINPKGCPDFDPVALSLNYLLFFSMKKYFSFAMALVAMLAMVSASSG